MARTPEPRWYPSRGGWYCWHRGKQIRLAAGKGAKAEAWRAFHRLMLEAEPEKEKDSCTAIVLFDLLLDWLQTNREQSTYSWYRWHLERAAKAIGQIKAAELRPSDVERWLNREPYNRSTRHGAITAVKRAFSWGLKNGYLARNPLAHLEKPGIEQRKTILSSEQLDQIFAACDSHFRDLLTVLHETGMRPSEAYAIEAGHVDWDRSLCVLAKHKTWRKTRRPRIVYLTPRVLDLLRALAATYKEGPILRNRNGTPWKPWVVAHRFARLRDRLGLGPEATADSLRHLFVTDALEQGVPVATVAELVGHRSTAMVERHYGHLASRSKHLHDAVQAIRPDEPQGDEQ